MFIERLLFCDARVNSSDARVCAMHVIRREEHVIKDDDGYQALGFLP